MQNFRRSHKWQYPQETRDGRAFIRIGNTRFYLDDCMTFAPPYGSGYPTLDGVEWHGYFGLTYFSSYYLRARTDEYGDVQYQYCYVWN